MKTRPLPDIDLARIAPLPSDQKRRELNRFKFGRPQLSYDPLRQSLADIANAKAGMFHLPHTPFDKISNQIVRNSRTHQESMSNLQVAEGLYTYIRENSICSRKHDFLPLALSVGQRIVYWHSMILIVEGVPTVPFFDPRRSPRLTSEARRFVFSTMHERIRRAEPDLAQVRLAIFQFSDAEKEEAREPRVFTDENVSLFSFEELDDMVRETYELWQEISEEREDGMRRRAGGASGSLL